MAERDALDPEGHRDRTYLSGAVVAGLPGPAAALSHFEWKAATMTDVTAINPPTNRLRVLTVTPRYMPFTGGTEIHTYETTRRIAAWRNDVTVLTANPGMRLTGEEWADDVRVIRVPVWPADRDYYVAPSVSKVIARRTWDLVHCQGIHTLFAPIAMLAAWRARIPYVVTFHSGGHSSRLRTMMRGGQWTVLRPLLKRATRLIGVSEFEAEYFQHHLRIPAERFTVIPNGVQFPDSVTGIGHQTNETVIVSVGRLERYKGHHRVIAALPYVLARRSDARLHIVGSGPYEPQLTRMAAELGVAERVDIGAIPSTDRGRMAEVLAGASVVTLLSDYESQGIAVMEAIELKRPVLVSDGSALRELVQHGLARSVPQGSSPEQIAAAILEQIERPLVPANVALSSWDDCASQLLELYRQIHRSQSCVS